MSGHCSICGETGGCDCFQASPIEDDGLRRELLALAKALHRSHYLEKAPQWEPLDTSRGLLSQIDNMTAGMGQTIDEQSQSIRVMREAAEIGLEYVIEAANQRKEKDAVFDNAMRDIERIESALGASGHD